LPNLREAGQALIRLADFLDAIVKEKASKATRNVEQLAAAA
jgi:hypothetical protein